LTVIGGQSQITVQEEEEEQRDLFKQKQHEEIQILTQVAQN